MKAVIMAGGAGTRLRPLSCGVPKPMVTLCDRPVIEYIIDLLKQHGITDIYITLQYMPESITGHLGDGSRFGVNIKYSVETEPLGTAGSVKACGVCRDGEDFLVISGDAVCDMDLTSCIEFHKNRHAEATIVLYRSPSPLEYGLVVTDAQGRVERFVEKPFWGQVVTDAVNTGIYILSPSVMDRVPAKNAYDFGRELFPRLLKENARLYGTPAEGYWCDIGDTGAYLRCIMDVLSGKARLNLPAPEISKGLWSDSPIPDGACVVAPCYIGKDVELGEDCLVGPYCLLEHESAVKNQALVQYSAVNGATIGERSSAYACVVCRGAFIGEDVYLDRDCVIGHGARVENGAEVSEGVRIWPDKTVPSGARMETGVAGAEVVRSLVFDGDGIIEGRADTDLTPDYCLRLGLAMAGCLTGEIGVSREGGEAARACALAFEAGVRAAGSAAVSIDAACAPAVSFAARHLGFAGCAFFKLEGGALSVRLFGGDGMALPRNKMRSIEAALYKGEFLRAPADNFGRGRSLSGIHGACASAAAAEALDLLKGSLPTGLRVHAAQTNPVTEIIRQALIQSGCRLSPQPKGVISLSAGEDDSLSALDEDGKPIPPGRLTVLRALLELKLGSAAVAVGPGAPSAVDSLPLGGGRVMRLGRDGDEAYRLYSKQFFMVNPVYGAARLCTGLMKTGMTLKQLNSEIPAFYTVSREASLKNDRGRVMKALGILCAEDQKQVFEGMHVTMPGGVVHISPHFSRRSLLITGEGASEEIAEELCALFEKRADEADKWQNEK